MPIIEFEQPIKGLSEGLPIENQPANTSGHMNNVRPIDVLERRIRIGQRPGMDKAYSQQIGGIPSPIIVLLSITTVD